MDSECPVVPISEPKSPSLGTYPRIWQHCSRHPTTSHQISSPYNVLTVPLPDPHTPSTPRPHSPCLNPPPTLPSCPGHTQPASTQYPRPGHTHPVSTLHPAHSPCLHPTSTPSPYLPSSRAAVGLRWTSHTTSNNHQGTRIPPITEHTQPRGAPGVHWAAIHSHTQKSISAVQLAMIPILN